MVDPEARENNEKQLDEIVNDLTGDDAEPIDNVEQPVTIESLQEQLKQANDRVLRAQAELENFRKRARRDLEEQRQYANLPLVSDLIPAFDNLDRAVEAAEQNADIAVRARR